MGYDTLGAVAIGHGVDAHIFKLGQILVNLLVVRMRLIVANGELVELVDLFLQITQRQVKENKKTSYQMRNHKTQHVPKVAQTLYSKRPKRQSSFPCT